MSLDEETRGKLGALLAEQRNLRQKECEIIDEFLNYLGGRPFAETVAVREETFLNLLGWEKSQGTLLGEFEFTSRKANNSDVFNHAYNILKANNAAINHRFHGEVFQFSYWLYEQKPDVIYRQALKAK